MEKIIRINMDNLETKIEEVAKEYQLLGARCLTSMIVFNEIPPLCNALERNNKLIFAPGILGGTIAPSSNRLSAGAKSPLTGGIKECSAGGPGGQKLGKMGVKALIIEGKPKQKKLYILIISHDSVKLIESENLRGLGTYDTTKKLIKEYGNKTTVISIGPAGEMKMGSANIAATDAEGKPTRQFGRGGLGAVMGSKGIKAIVVQDPGNIHPHIQKDVEFKNLVRTFTKALIKNPVSGSVFSNYGTAVLVSAINEFGAFPTRNFSSGKFEMAENISGEKMTEIIKSRGGKVGHPCAPGCVIKCSNIYVDKNGEEITGGFEYESICLLGSNLGIGNLDEIAQLNRLCDDYGLDTIEIGAVLGIVMEAGLIEFGDYKGVVRLIKEIKEGSIIGRVLGQGATITGKVFGITRIPAVKGQAMAAYDPRAIIGMGATYATSPMGADHTAGASVMTYIKGEPGNQVNLAGEYQIKSTALENTGLCRFVSYALFTDRNAMDSMLKMIGAKYGINISEKAFLNWGLETLKIERKFNKLAGFNEAHDTLPEFFKEEKLPPYNKVYNLPDKELKKITEQWE